VIAAIQSGRICYTAIISIFASTICFAEIRPPEAGEWVDRGTILEAGSGWDLRLTGAISPCTVIKKDGLFYLYYIGADGDRSTDGGPRHRALGVATSQDGITFTKYQGNPVITYLPHNNEEEGVFSAAGMVDTNGDVVIYYGALHASNSTTEQVDIYITLATSSDGLNFDNRGSRGEFAFAPDGDEVDPIGVMRDQDTWYVYYINNRGWKLNLAAGSSMNRLEDLGSVSGTGGTAKGGGDPLFINESEFVSFVDHYDSKDPLVVRGSLNSPRELTQVDRYDWGSDTHNHSATYLDSETGNWYMYYQNKGSNSIGVKIAPVVDDGVVNTKPNPPEKLIAE
jgi:hypothetical protein